MISTNFFFIGLLGGCAVVFAALGYFTNSLVRKNRQDASSQTKEQELENFSIAKRAESFQLWRLLYDHREGLFPIFRIEDTERIVRGTLAPGSGASVTIHIGDFTLTGFVQGPGLSHFEEIPVGKFKNSIVYRNATSPLALAECAPYEGRTEVGRQIRIKERYYDLRWTKIKFGFALSGLIRYKNREVINFYIYPNNSRKIILMELEPISDIDKAVIFHCLHVNLFNRPPIDLIFPFYRAGAPLPDDL